ncbi:MAG: ATP-binding protein [Candidatus Riflebacteria bacterium]|nr:ATP-binding protein [Candidatus Riflebacteria bacterium]
MQKQAVSDVVCKPGERRFRSFKTRYLFYYLPAMLLVTGLLTIVLVTASHRSLILQQQANFTRRFDHHGEHLRIMIIGSQMKGIASELQDIAERLDLPEISLYNPARVCVASFSSGIDSSSHVEMILPLSVKNGSDDDASWHVVLKTRKTSYVGLIDSFMIYQLVIILVLVIGSVTGTFLAFDNMVAEPLFTLNFSLKGLLEKREDSFIDFYENDELGSTFSLVNQLVKQQQDDKQRLKSFFKQSEILCFQFDPSADTFTFSAGHDTLPGLDAAIIRTTGDLFAYVDSSQRAEIRQKWYDVKDRSATEESGSDSFEFRLLNSDEENSKSNNRQWVQLKIFWNRNAEKTEISGFIKDITQIRRREVELKGLADSFRQIYENSPIGIWRCICQKDQYTYMNSSMARILGYSSSEEALKTIASISHDVFFNPGERTFFLDEVKKRDQVVNLELRFKRADGSIFWGAIFGRLYCDQSIQYCEGGLLDITERKLLDERLRSDEEFLRQGLEASGLVIWQLEPVSGQLKLKGAVPELLGPGIPEVTTLKILQRIIHPEDLALFSRGIDKIRRGESTGQSKNSIEFRICRVDVGQKVSIRWLGVVAARSEIIIDGRPGFIQGVFVDITHQKEAEQKLSCAVESAVAESRHKSEFFASVSHEVRTPLNAIIGFSELLLPMLQDSRAEHYVSSILSSSRSLVNILNSMLDLSRLEAGRIELVRESVRMVDMIADIRQMFVSEAEKRGLEFKTSVDAGVPPTLMLDELRVRQIICNLVSNSLRFTSSGSISVNISAVMNEPMQSADLLISIHDTGQGIHSDDLKEIFKPISERTHRKISGHAGAGMSLVICHHLVELMGGKIKVKSEIQCGTHFDIILKDVKLADSESTSVATRPIRQNFSFNGQKILVADDTASNRELMAEAMRGAGLQVICASDGVEALELAVKENPELIFMDIRMPLKDGIVATRELKSLPGFAAVPVIAVTASASVHEEKALTELFDSFLYKPVSLVRLFSEAARYLKQSVQIAAAAAVPVPVNLVMPPEAFEQLHEPWHLVESISQTFLPRLKELEGAVAVEDATRLAGELKTLSMRHSFNHLTIEAEQLNSCLERFDLPGVDNSRKRIGQIFRQVLTVYSRKAAE